MKPLLIAINAKYIHTNNAVRLLKANSLFDVEFFEFTIHDSISHMIEKILAHKPTLIGFSSYIWNIEIILELSKIIKASLNIPIILGGPEVSYDEDYFLSYPFIDMIVKGEGEYVLDDIIKHFHLGYSLSYTPNIASRDYTSSIQEITSLTDLHPPYFSHQDLQDITHRINYIESSRGCPYKCSYCLSSLEKSVRFFSLNQVTHQLDILNHYHAKTIKFLDRTFNANKQSLEIMQYIIKHHQKDQSYQFEITGDRLDEYVVDYLHAHAPKHLFRFEVGIQSTYDVTNKLVDRYQDNHKLFSLLKKILQEDIIDLHLDLIAGLPLESLERFKRTFNEVYMLGAKEVQLGFLKMLRGTKIRKQANRFGYIFNQNPPYEIYSNTILSEKDILEIKRVEDTLNTFHNKGHFRGLVYDIAKNISPFDFFLELHNFVITKNFDLHRYQRDELFDILEQFLNHKNYSLNMIDKIRYHYLIDAKVKPKCYFDIVTNKLKKEHIFKSIPSLKDFSLRYLSKNSIVVYLNAHPHVFLYENHKVTSYQ